MAVINTNIMALIGQQNLRKSQSDLQTAMERLSSGLRINSAADDAAGEAIANRMTAQVTGLQQASRNANDGISVAQTTEGALNQINDNLQRIRQLSVEAANGTNSSSDLSSIQDEINQRLDEIDRVSQQTSFNGVSVLASNQSLRIQVGANDDQVIDIQLNKIDRQTLGLSNFNVENQITSDQLHSAALTSLHMTAVGMTAVSSTITAATPATSVALSFHTTADTFAPELGSDGKLYVRTGASAGSYKYYSATFNQSANTLTFNSDTSVAAPTSVVAAPTTFINGSGNVVQWSTITGATQDNSGATASSYKVGQTASGVLFAKNSGGSVTYTLTTTTASAGTASANTINLTTGYVKLGSADAAAATGVNATDGSGVLHLPGTAAVNVNMSAVNANSAVSGGTNTLVQNSAGAYFVKSVAGSATTYYAASLATSTGVVTLGAALASGSNTELVKDDAGSYFVKSTGSAGTTYHNATMSASGKVTVGAAVGSAGDTLLTNSAGHMFVRSGTGSTAVFYGATVSTGGTVTVGSAFTSAGDTLIQNSAGALFVKSGSGSAATYYGTNTSSTGAISLGSQTVVDPLATLDRALSQVDDLRSNLGAYQNRFESAIENLGSTTTNLSAARSRIQDADYATEVSAMTRAQILQQAGTSVLAQANQVPQTVLKLLQG